jgi:hypothetical protein
MPALSAVQSARGAGWPLFKRVAESQWEVFMKRSFILIVAIALVAPPAAADGAGSLGASGLALAALVGLESPTLSAVDKQELGDMLNGDVNFPGNAPITVAADSVSCRQSDVDISHHDCTLKFGGATKPLNGRAAHELYATLIENGVPSDGAAGSIYDAVSHLSCTIKPAEVKQRGGDGASCAWAPGP